jgi:hypothetical protein
MRWGGGGGDRAGAEMEAAVVQVIAKMACFP